MSFLSEPIVGFADSLYLRVLQLEDASQLVELEQQLFTAEAWSLALVQEELRSPWSHYFGIFQARPSTPSTSPSTPPDNPSTSPSIPPANPSTNFSTNPSTNFSINSACAANSTYNSSYATNFSRQSERLAANQSERLVAYVGYKGEWEADLTVVGVLPEFRRQGLGRSLVEFALLDAQKNGVSVMFLEVRASNSIAQRLYETLGFQVVNRIRGYYRNPPEDALLMSVNLTDNDQ